MSDQLPVGLQKLIERIKQDPAQPVLRKRILALVADMPRDDAKLPPVMALAKALLPADPRESLRLAHMVQEFMPGDVASLQLMVAALRGLGRSGKAAVLQNEIDRIIAERRQPQRKRNLPLPQEFYSILSDSVAEEMPRSQRDRDIAKSSSSADETVIPAAPNADTRFPSVIDAHQSPTSVESTPRAGRAPVEPESKEREQGQVESPESQESQVALQPLQESAPDAVAPISSSAPGALEASNEADDGELAQLWRRVGANLFDFYWQAGINEKAGEVLVQFRDKSRDEDWWQQRRNLIVAEGEQKVGAGEAARVARKWGQYLDQLLKEHQDRKAFFEIRDVIHQFPFDELAAEAWPRLPMIWQRLGMLGLSYQPDSGARVLQETLSKAPQHSWRTLTF